MSAWHMHYFLGMIIRSVEDSHRLFRKMESEFQEVVWAGFLTSRHRVIKVKEIFRGTLTHAPACPREILREALRFNCAKFLIAHNHPSGSPYPSREDRKFTEMLEMAAVCIGVTLVDHLIVAEGGEVFQLCRS